MAAIYKKEMRSYFTNMTGAVAIAVMLLVMGLMFRFYNLYNGLLTFHYAVSNSTLIFYIVVPILSMRVFAEERRQKTDQLLLTAPVSITEIVFGKYLALITVLAIPVIISCIYPLMMLRFGEETLLWDYACIAAFYLMGCAYLAVGMFISSCTESTIIAAILSILFVFVTQMLSSVFTIISTSGATALIFLVVLAVLAGLLLYVMTWHAAISGITALVLILIEVLAYYMKPEWFDGRTESVLRVLDFSTHFSDFAGGVFSLSNLFFFVSYVAAGILLTILSIDRKRWS